VTTYDGWHGHGGYIFLNDKLALTVHLPDSHGHAELIVDALNRGWATFDSPPVDEFTIETVTFMEPGPTNDAGS
jgi:hypothetical protein